MKLVGLLLNVVRSHERMLLEHYGFMNRFFDKAPSMAEARSASRGCFFMAQEDVPVPTGVLLGAVERWEKSSGFRLEQTEWRCVGSGTDVPGVHRLTRTDQREHCPECGQRVQVRVRSGVLVYRDHAAPFEYCRRGVKKGGSR